MHRWHLMLTGTIVAVSFSLAVSVGLRDVAGQSEQADAPETGNQSVRRRILTLLETIHRADDAASASAREELQSFGLTGRQIELAGQLFDPDPRVRRELAGSLADADPQTAEEILYELTFDAEHRVRIAALEALQGRSPAPKLQQRVGELADADSHSAVRGHARLLRAEWSVREPRGGEVESRESRVQSRQPKQAALSSSGLSTLDPGLSIEETSPYATHIPTDPSPLRGPPALKPVRPYWIKAPEEKVQGPESGAVQSPESRVQSEQPLQAANSSSGLSTLDAGLLIAGLSTLNSQLSTSPVQPDVLRRPTEILLFGPDGPPTVEVADTLLRYPIEAPLGFTGPSGVLPTEYQDSDHFVPLEDRWRIGFDEWDRYDKDHPWVDDYPSVEGHWWDPYNQNVLKGDYPLIGQHTFLTITATSQMIHEFRQLPAATTPFESTVNPFQEEFFGNPDQYFYLHNFRLTINLAHGTAAFKPPDWQVRVTPVFNLNYLDVEELGIVNPDVREGTTRFRDDLALEEWFVEAKLADLSPDYDFISLRAGSQFFNSDFRGFIFNDTNRGVRLFGTLFSNRDQFNIAYFDQTEKNTNSFLNTFEDRDQNTLIMNYYRQDFIFPGYTAEFSFHFNRDGPSFLFDKNDFLVRPDPAGVFQPHTVESYYLGFAGDGHIGRVNISNAFYWVTGQDSLNPIAGDSQTIDAYMAAIELSYDRDWIRFRASYFYASGDDDPADGRAEGFDTIVDNPNFAGGQFSYWQRQSVRLFGVNLMQFRSLVPDLRSSKFQGQSNFVNPGLHLFNLGMDFEVTPKAKVITNANFLWFDETGVLETFVFQDRIQQSIGTDLSVGLEYRPFLNDNMIVLFGVAGFFPESGFKDLFGVTDPFNVLIADAVDVSPMFDVFMELVLTY